MSYLLGFFPISYLPYVFWQIPKIPDRRSALILLRSKPVHRSAFYHSSFQWIYYYGSNKSTGKETGKSHLCAVGEFYCSNSGQLEALVLSKSAVVTLLPESRSDCNRGDTILHHGGLRWRKLGQSSSRSDGYDDVKLATVSDWSLTHCIVRRIFSLVKTWCCTNLLW